MAPHLQPGSPLLRSDSIDSGMTGLIDLPQGPLLVASYAILTSEGQGPARGRLLWGRFLDAREIALLARTTRLSVSVQSLSQRDRPREIETALASLSDSTDVSVRPLGPESIAGYAILDDIFGKPALVLQVEGPRPIYAQGQTTRFYFMLTVFIVSATFIAIGAVLLEKLEESKLTLAQSEEYFRSLIENSQDIILIADRDGKIRYVTPSVERVSGFKPEEVSARSIFEFVHPDDLKVAANLFIYVAATPGYVTSLELRARRADGGWYYVEAVGKNAMDNPAVKGIILNIRNITERKRAEAELGQWLAFQKTVSTMSSHLLDVSGIGTAITRCLADIGELSNSSHAYLLEFSQDGSQVTNAHEWCAAGAVSRKDALKDLSVVGFPSLVARLKKGEIVRVQDTASMSGGALEEKDIVITEGARSFLMMPLYIGSEVRGLLGLDNVIAAVEWSDDDLALLRIAVELFGRAISRKQVEDALRQSEEKWRETFNALRDVVWITDTGCRILKTNQAFDSAVRMSPEDISGKNCREVFAGAESVCSSCPHNRASATGQPAISEVFVPRATAYMEISVSPVFDSNHEVASLVHVGRDVGERKWAEDKLLELYRKEVELREKLQRHEQRGE